MFAKIKNTLKSPFIQQFRDVRSLGLLVFGVLVLLVSWSGIKVIQTNYELQRHIAKLQQQVDVQKLENSNLSLRNEYLRTDHYLELSARKNFSKAAPDEKVWIVPKSVALSHAPEIELNKEDGTAKDEQKPQRNFEAWMNFFFHRPQPTEE